MVGAQSQAEQGWGGVFLCVGPREHKSLPGSWRSQRPLWLFKSLTDFPKSLFLVLRAEGWGQGSLLPGIPAAQ